MISEDNAVRVALADFADRRGEVDNRSRAQHALFTLNMTIAGVAASVVAADQGTQFLLLAVAPISASLGMFWAVHERMIFHIGDYIYDYVKPVVDPARRGPLLHWEAVHDVYSSRWQRARYAIPVLLVFTLPAAAALFTSLEVVRHSNSVVAWIGWGMGFLLTAYAAVLLMTSGIFAKNRGRTSGSQRLA